MGEGLATIDKTNILTATEYAEAVSGTRQLVSIGQLAAEMGITPAAIRFYESEGLLSPRRIGRLRAFSPDDRQRLASIVRLRKMGLPMAEMAAAIEVIGLTLQAERAQRTQSIFKAHLGHLEDRFVALQHKIDCTAAALAAVLNRTPAASG